MWFTPWSLVNSRSRWMFGVLAGAVMAFTLIFTVKVGAQTLFALPDTTPDFASYRYLEECDIAAQRLADELETRKNPIWEDTMSAGMQESFWIKRARSRRPETAINAASVCLAQFNADTVHIRGLGYARYILDVLLIAHRDQDARRFAQRLLDSVQHQSEWKLRDALGVLMNVFGRARPVRMDDVKRYYAETLLAVKDDSLAYTIFAAKSMSNIANGVGDTALFEEAGWHAIRTLDAIPVKERPKIFPGGPDGFLGRLESLLRLLTKQEGFDSLSISTTAYKMWEANTVRVRIYGEEEQKASKDIELSKLPDLVGEHYYVTSDVSSGAVGQRRGMYTKRSAVPGNEIPVREHVNLIYGLPSYCHAEGQYKWIDQFEQRSKSAFQCAPVYAMLRRLKQRVPELEITILSSTYGTVGQLGPLKPAEEADTLAKFWLGWHHIPARLVVEERPFFMVPEPDGRRIDLPTPYSDTLHRRITFPLMFLTDQDGVKIDFLRQNPYQIESEDNIRFLETLVRRGRK